MINKNKIEHHKQFFITLLVAFFSVSLFFNEASLASQINHIEPRKSSGIEKNYKEGEVIVRYKDKEKLNQKIEKINQGEVRRNFAKINKKIESAKIALIKSDNKKTKDLISELKDDENIEIVEPNYIRELAYVPNDSYFSAYQWAHRNTGQNILGTVGTVDADSDITEAWDIEESGADETIVAVLDSGVRHSHADLSGNMWDGTICVDENNLAIPAGCPNHGWDYENSDNDPDDTDGHGTHVASIIGSTTSNSSGIAGISRYNNIKIMALRFDLGVFNEIDAINFAKNNGAKVINGSFSGSGYSAIEKSAIDNFDGIFVAAAGNGGIDNIGDNNEVTPQYPCNYTSVNIICVAATDQNDVITSFSNYGTTSVDLAAPGSNVIGYSYTGGGGWDYYLGDGTSFASPLVAGTVGVLYSHDSSLTTSQVRDYILDNVDSKAGLASRVVTGGRLNFNRSLDALLNPTTRPVYRFYSPQNKAHFYTVSNSEKSNIIATYTEQEWRYEGIGYYVPISVSGNRPVYRFYSSQNKSHFFTISESEKNNIIAIYTEEEWRYEGIAYYVPTSSSGNRPMYRFWSPQNKAHFFTISGSEKDRIIATYTEDEWRYEGIAYYVPN